MPDANTAPPGLFRDLETLARTANTLATKLEEAGVEVAALPVDDPVRVAVEGRVSEGSTAASDPDFERLRSNDPDYVAP
mgnify:CR=1 FL=1